ncbi:MAG: winged helix-turn-helix domain-containing protein [Defluviitaleaceae bacterium]|nr:winged helix-turn-helix domain-containing protein [Defluviitaleaceae bacterium]
MFNNHEQCVKLFDALSHPARIKILGVLLKERQYVSELARIVNISRALLYMHLKKLEGAGLVIGHAEISSSGKATKYYEAVAFEVTINSAFLTALGETIVITTGAPSAQ